MCIVLARQEERIRGTRDPYRSKTLACVDAKAPLSTQWAVYAAELAATKAGRASCTRVHTYGHCTNTGDSM